MTDKEKLEEWRRRYKEIQKFQIEPGRTPDNDEFRFFTLRDTNSEEIGHLHIGRSNVEKYGWEFIIRAVTNMVTKMQSTKIRREIGLDENRIEIKVPEGQDPNEVAHKVYEFLKELTEKKDQPG